MDQRERLHVQVELTLTNRPLVDPSLESRLETISADLRTAGHAIVDLCPPSRELSLALTSLQETRMFAVAAIALHQERIGPVQKLIEAGEGKRQTPEQAATRRDAAVHEHRDDPGNLNGLSDDELDRGV